MEKLSKEDIILIFLENPNLLARKIEEHKIEKSDEMRQLICELGDPDCAYRYADYIDKVSNNLTRKVACRDSKYAFWYAKHVDNGPHEETRKGACKDPSYALYYASQIDKKPTSMTYNSTRMDPFTKNLYRTWVKAQNKYSPS